MNRLLLTCIAAGSFVGVVGVAAYQSSTSTGAAPPFRKAVEGHLAAVTSRNMDALLPTLTLGTELTMIGPTGQKWDTRQQYVDFHRQWFATKDDGKWELIEMTRVIESPALGHALVKYRYSFKDPTGKTQASVAWLALTFALEKGAWRLVFDQNTGIAAAPPPPAAR